jgi:hypothetical protein
MYIHEDTLKMDLKRAAVCECELNSRGSEMRFSGGSEDDTETSGSIKCWELFD